MRWKKTHQHRKEWPDDADVIIRASDQVIERRLERLRLRVGFLHPVHSLEKLQKHRTAGDLTTELYADRCEYRVV